MSIDNVLRRLQAGELTIEQAEAMVRQAAADERYRTADLGFAQLDLEREHRTGFPEVVYGEGKSSGQIADIVRRMQHTGSACLVTRVDAGKAGQVQAEVSGLRYHPEARMLTWRAERPAAEPDERYVAVVCAGTSDIPVAEEAAVTAEQFGCRVQRIYDVGVAGIHRLFKRLPDIRGASCIVAVAGMEGALVSVVSGLVQAPVVAVPTSVGYGTHLQGLVPLLGMLNACAPGVAVVNVDNGFGAGYFASSVLRQQARHDEPEAKP